MVIRADTATNDRAHSGRPMSKDTIMFVMVIAPGRDDTHLVRLIEIDMVKRAR